MIEIVTAASDREEIAFAKMMAEKYGLKGPTYFLNDLLNGAIRQLMAAENWSSDMTDTYLPRSEGAEYDDGIPF